MNELRYMHMIWYC